jgi:hypothetical protein
MLILAFGALVVFFVSFVIIRKKIIRATRIKKRNIYSKKRKRR